MKSLTHALEGAAVALLAQAPALLSSQAARDFVSRHPTDAVFVPVAVGVASAAYRYAKNRWQKPAPVVAAVQAAPVGPVAPAPVDPPKPAA